MLTFIAVTRGVESTPHSSLPSDSPEERQVRVNNIGDDEFALIDLYEEPGVKSPEVPSRGW